MNKHIIVVKRAGIHGFLSTQEIDTDAINAMHSIPGVSNPEVLEKSNDMAKLSVDFTGTGPFLETNEHLIKFGLVRID